MQIYFRHKIAEDPSWCGLNLKDAPTLEISLGRNSSIGRYEFWTTI